MEFSDKRSFIWLTVASLSPASCCRRDEHKSSVLHRVCAGDLVGIECRYFRTTIMTAWTLHRSAWSLRECRAPSNVWVVFKSFVSEDDLQCNQWVRKEAIPVQVFTEVRGWSLAHFQFCIFVLVTECVVLSIRSSKYHLFRGGGIRVLEITLIYSSLESLSWVLRSALSVSPLRHLLVSSVCHKYICPTRVCCAVPSSQTYSRICKRLG